jgi:hypothetical protein
MLAYVKIIAAFEGLKIAGLKVEDWKNGRLEGWNVENGRLTMDDLISWA